MNTRSIQIIFILASLTVATFQAVNAVTDAELEALEKQLEQQETQAIEQAEKDKLEKAAAEAKRKAEQSRKREAEVRRKQQEELNRLAEEKARLQGERAKLADMERQRLHEEEQRKAEAVKQEQFSQYMRNAETAMNDKKYEEASQSYSQAVEIYPNDAKALAGQTKARELNEACSALVGEWDWVFDVFVVVSADGNLQAKALISNTGTWECTDPLQRKFTLHWVVGGWVDTVTLSEDGNHIKGINNIGFGFEAWRKGTKPFNPTREIKL